MTIIPVDSALFLSPFIIPFVSIIKSTSSSVSYSHFLNSTPSDSFLIFIMNTLLSALLFPLVSISLHVKHSPGWITSLSTLTTVTIVLTTDSLVIISFCL